jgi:uncharacterized protein (DUF924 family)
MTSLDDRSNSPEPAWVGDVLHFWFEQLSEQDWFAKSDALDELIRKRFLAIYERLVASDAADVSGGLATLAAVIVLDQFSRNMFRGDPRAFAADPLARRIARRAIDDGVDRALSNKQRLFLYLPFEHSEDAADQALALELMSALNNPAWTRFAVAHKQIIDRFGRFPHRNAVLGRESTADEIEMLKGPMSSF